MTYAFSAPSQDHYKLALGQLNAARGMIDKVAQVDVFSVLFCRSLIGMGLFSNS